MQRNNIVIKRFCVACTVVKLLGTARPDLTEECSDGELLLLRSACATHSVVCAVDVYHQLSESGSSCLKSAKNSTPLVGAHSTAIVTFNAPCKYVLIYVAVWPNYVMNMNQSNTEKNTHIGDLQVVRRR